MPQPTGLFTTIALLIAVGATVGTVLLADADIPAHASLQAAVDADGFVTSPNLALIPRTAPDHVMRMERDEGSGANPRKIVTVMRHGDYRREEWVLPPGNNAPYVMNVGRRRVEFFNVATGAALHTVLFDDGAPLQMTVFGGQEQNYNKRGPSYRTDRSEQIAGERCTVWRSDPRDPDLAARGFGLTYEACVTADNIVLSETYIGGSNYRHQIRRAISVERRPVAEAEVRPDKRYFDWRYWSELKADVAPLPRAFPVERYEVSLAGTDARGKGMRVANMRGFGDWTLQETLMMGAYRWFALSNGQVSLSASFREGDVPDQLSVQVHQVFPAQLGLPPLASGPDLGAETVLGERCVTRENFRTSHNVSLACRTADGLTLKTVESGGYGGGSTTESRAIKIERGRTTPRSVAIPSGIFDRTRWGW
jgi:hypothetical protein